MFVVVVVVKKLLVMDNHGRANLPASQPRDATALTSPVGAVPRDSVRERERERLRGCGGVAVWAGGMRLGLAWG